MIQKPRNARSPLCRTLLCVVALTALAPTIARGQQASVSVGCADFRVWAYIPYWATQSQINSFGTNGMYSHVSDVIYFGGYRTDSLGNLSYASSTYQTQLETMRAQSAQYGFNMELSMYEVNGGLSTNDTWTALVNSPTARANFVSQLKTFMQAGRSTPAIKGFNFDWELPTSGICMATMYSSPVS